MKKALGGDRLKTGKKMEVDLRGYGRSNHDLGYLWRGTMAAGTLVPFLKEVILPGDTFDINLDCDIKTHPTIGPLFGSYKVQLDVFMIPWRLYNGKVHNNKLNVGLKMSDVKLPVISLRGYNVDTMPDLDNSQINPSSLLACLGIRGVGRVYGVTEYADRRFNAAAILGYYDLLKNYYANKQETNAYVISNVSAANPETIDEVHIVTGLLDTTLPEAPTAQSAPAREETIIQVEFTGTAPNPDGIGLQFPDGRVLTMRELIVGAITINVGVMGGRYNYAKYGATNFQNWRYVKVVGRPIMQSFPLKEIDDMREALLSATGSASAINILETGLYPYQYLNNAEPGQENILLGSQQGLAVKTYLSDLLNNWLSTEWIDGVGGISEITAVDTSDGSFTMDTLNLSKKVYIMLNRILVSGGSYDDWINAVYDIENRGRAEIPMYMGGLNKELVFQEVVNVSESQGDSGTQPLGTLAGKGVMARGGKGGHIVIKADEPGYVMGLVSLTPRLDYSQGNDWDIHIQTFDDLHKPQLDEIGFQELITERMAWWDTQWTPDGSSGVWTTFSAGKQPAWIEYMTNINRTRGNFAVQGNEMFMTLNRRYEMFAGRIGDITTYIDPMKFNDIFAETARDAQNFWTQISVDIHARRVMSEKIIPNL